MDTSPRDRITVDLQGLKAALMARAEFDGVMPSQVVRQALVAVLGSGSVKVTQPKQPTKRLRSQRLCLRMRPEEIRAVLSSAALAGQPPARWVARAAAGEPAGATAEQVHAQHTALVAMTAELAALHRVLQRVALHSRMEPETAGADVIQQVLCDLRALLVSTAVLTRTRSDFSAAAAHPTIDGSLARRAT